MSADVIHGMTNLEYHARPELSSTGARTMLKSPALYRWQQDHPVFSEPFDFGSAAHKVVLGDESTALVEIDADDWRTKAAKEARDEARAAGKVPLLAKDARVVRDMAAAIRQHPIASALLAPTGEPEVSVFWNGRRARFDHLPAAIPGRRLIVPDYKTAASAAEADFKRSVGTFGYHQQEAWYRDALTAMGHDDAAFLFIVQERVAPYLVNVIQLDEEAHAIGAALNERAHALWLQCQESGQWPGYGTDVKTVGLPRWAVYEFEETAA